MKSFVFLKNSCDKVVPNAGTDCGFVSKSERVYRIKSDSGCRVAVARKDFERRLFVEYEELQSVFITLHYIIGISNDTYT